MKTTLPPHRKLASICAFTLLAVGSLAGLVSPVNAGTISGGSTTWNGVSATTKPPKITTAGQIIQVKHSFGVAYYGPDKTPNWTCWAKLDYSDGTPPEMRPITYPADSVAVMKQYTKPGAYTVTLTGTAHNGKPACLGNASTTMTIDNGIPRTKLNIPAAAFPPGAGPVNPGQPPATPSPKAPVAPPAAAPQAGMPGLPGQLPTVIKPRLTAIALAQTEFSPGVVNLIADLQSTASS
jgi:hypothetical protein